jgi:transposase
VIGVERGQEIRERFFRDGESIRSIARALHMSRRTVAKYLESGPPWEYTLNSPRPRPVVDEIEARVRAILVQDQTVRNRKQRHTANRIYERLVEEHAFRGSERAVRRLVAELREELSLEKKEVFLPLQFAYGQAFENDWFEADAVLDGQLTRTNVFVSRLRASRASWLVAQPTQRREALLDGIQRGLRFFGGVPEVGRFDNPATVVTMFGREKKESAEFAQFRAHYNFRLSLCQAGKGNEKGSVESLAGFATRHFFTPVPEFKDLDALNAWLAQKCEEYLKYPVPDSQLRVGEALEQERRYLLPLPERDYDAAQLAYVRATKQALVQFDHHRYSVPAEYAYRQLLVKGYVQRVVILSDGVVVAEHPRSYRKGGDSYQLEHYLGVLVHKPGAIVLAKPVLASELGDLIRQFAAGAGAKTARPVSELARVMALMRKHGVQVVGPALEAAVQRGCFTADAVECILHSLMEADPPPAPLALAHYPSIPQLVVPAANLQAYDRLLERK